MNQRNATIHDVAARAGVSIKTVSRVFNNEPNVRPETRKRVLAAAKALDYFPNVSARRLASRQSLVIGLVYDNPLSDYVTEIQDGALKKCRVEGYNLLIHPCEKESPDLIDEIRALYRQQTVDGFILTPPVSELESVAAALAEDGIPCVRISQLTEISSSPCVCVDDEQAAHGMTEFLISLGHRRIGFIIGNPAQASSHDRFTGFKSALAAHGIPMDQSLIGQGLYTFESGLSSARRLLSVKTPPTAIFASNDHMAMGVVRAAQERGLRIPEDLSVCGFDDSVVARYVWPPLTTVRQPVEEVAGLATQLLIQDLRGCKAEANVYMLRSELIPRQSTGRCNT